MKRSVLIVLTTCCLLGSLAVLSILPIPNSDDRRSGQAQSNQTRTVESELESLIFQGPELHDSLITRPMDDSVRHLPAGLEMPQNPYISTDAKYVKAIAGASSQGRLKEDGVRAVLYALYADERELGFYGIEAATIADADRRESKLRKIWARNALLNRARVHRKGLVLLVIWTDGVSPECWNSVNARVVERLNALTTRGADE